MTETRFGWAVLNGMGHIMLPVESTRVAAIVGTVASFDASLTGQNSARLTEAQTLAWRRHKRNYGLQCVRVKVEVAFGGGDE